MTMMISGIAMPEEVMLEEKMCIEYKEFKGQVVFKCDDYVTFNPFNTKALLLIYRQNWKDVTLL